MDSYFEYIIFTAFGNLLAYDNRRNLRLIDLHNYRINLCHALIKYYNETEELRDRKHKLISERQYEERTKDFYFFNVDMTPEKEAQLLKAILIKYKNIFTYHNGIITMSDDMSLDDIKVKLYSCKPYKDGYNFIFLNDLIGLSDNIECLKALNVKKKTTYISDIVSKEQKIEEMYVKFSENELEDILKDINKDLYLKMALIGNLNIEQMKLYHRIIQKMKYYSLPEDKCLVLSKTLRDNYEFYKNNDIAIKSYFANEFQRAIFGAETLVYDKLDTKMNVMWVYLEAIPNIEFGPLDLDYSVVDQDEDEEDDDFIDSFDEIVDYLPEELFEEDEDGNDYLEYQDDLEADFDYSTYDEEIINPSYDADEEDESISDIEIYLLMKKINEKFYLSYIDKLNKYEEVNGKDQDLELSKKRLLYILDNEGESFYKNDNLQKRLDSCKELTQKEEFSEFYTLSRLFLIDLLEGWIDDEDNIRKLLFVSTYYDITKDKAIEMILSEYEKTELGRKIKEIILDNNYSLLNEFKYNAKKASLQYIKKQRDKKKKAKK